MTALALHLVEATAGTPSTFNADGTLNVVILRPCRGRGPGGRIYTAEMLRENAEAFAGFPMFDNHEPEAAKRARQGLPRPPSDLAGQVLESWWDPNHVGPDDAKLGFDPGAVVGRAAVTDAMEQLVRRLPKAVKLSVNALATGVRPGVWKGKRGAIVEGIVGDPERGSVDFVTTAGAGGEVLLRESAVDDSLPAGDGSAWERMLDRMGDSGTNDVVGRARLRESLRAQREENVVLVEASSRSAWARREADAGLPLGTFGMGGDR